MKFLIENEHLQFFQDNQWIEFEDLLSAKQLETLQTEVNASPNKRRDLWRSSSPIKKIITHHHLGRILSELARVEPIVLAYDQLIEPPHPSELTLSEISAFQGLTVAALFCLHGECEEVPGIPKKPGNGTIIQPDFLLNWNFLAHHLDFRYLLVLYGERGTVYVANSKDPHCHTLKRLGFGFGDSLSSMHNPIVYWQK